VDVLKMNMEAKVKLISKSETEIVKLLFKEKRLLLQSYRNLTAEGIGVFSNKEN
jgi:asparagine synthetase A